MDVFFHFHPNKIKIFFLKNHAEPHGSYKKSRGLYNQFNLNKYLQRESFYF